MRYRNGKSTLFLWFSTIQNVIAQQKDYLNFWSRGTSSLNWCLFSWCFSWLQSASISKGVPLLLFLGVKFFVLSKTGKIWFGNISVVKSVKIIPFFELPKGYSHRLYICSERNHSGPINSKYNFMEANKESENQGKTHR